MRKELSIRSGLMLFSLMIIALIICFPGTVKIKDNVTADGVNLVKEANSAPVTEYSLSIAGIQVTDANKDDILGKGKKEAVYIPGTHTLELNGDIICDGICLTHSIYDLTIKVTKDIKIKSTDTSAIVAFADTTITGPGRLYVSAPESLCIGVGYKLTIKDANIYLEGAAGIGGGLTGEEKLVIDNSNIVCDCGEEAICYFEKGIEIKDAVICYDYSVRYVEGDSSVPGGYAVCDSSGSIAKYAMIIPGYGLIVGDIAVSKANKDDVLGNGKKEAVYIPETNTLELNGDIVSRTSYGIENYIQDLTIRTNKDVKITTQKFVPLVYLYADTTITGPGKLTLDAHASCPDLIYAGRLKIIDANIELLSGWYGITSNYNNPDPLIIENSYVYAMGEQIAVGYVVKGIDLRCVKITEPENAKILDDSGQIYYIGSADNVVPAKSVKMEPSHNWGKWTLTTPAQVGKKGVETRTCSDCGRKETREIPAVVPLKINKKNASVVCGNSLTLKAEGASTDVAWKSSDNKIATVDKNGKVTAKMAGTVTVTASAGGMTATCTVTVLYKDVTDSSDFWYAPTNYLTAKGVVKGYANQTEFRPSNDCTRAQMVTFLYRLQGEPKTKATTCKFGDVKSGDYFYKPVIWAVENGITTGVSAAKFEPQKVCTRAQTVTFLWRMAGKPEPAKNAKKFTDVETKDYFYKATLWASGMKILAGYDDGTFKPQGKCLRRQMVTFLYKYDKYVNGKG